jgi:copper chaperone CopZ
VNVDLDAGTLTVHGSRLDEEAVRRKIDEAGYVVRQRTRA